MRSSHPACYARQIVPSDDYPTRIIGCIALASVTVGFLLIYGLIFHPDDVRTPSLLKQTVTSHPALGRAALIAPLAPEPDMRSDTIRFANSDVVGQPTQAEPSPQVNSSSEREATEPGQDIPKPKAIKRLLADAANAYVSERYDRPEIRVTRFFLPAEPRAWMNCHHSQETVTVPSEDGGTREVSVTRC